MIAFRDDAGHLEQSCQACGSAWCPPRTLPRDACPVCNQSGLFNAFKIDGTIILDAGELPIREALNLALDASDLWTRSDIETHYYRRFAIERLSRIQSAFAKACPAEPSSDRPALVRWLSDCVGRSHFDTLSMTLREIESATIEQVIDGPTAPNTWINNGKKIEDSMDHLAWRMVSYLWAVEGWSCSWIDLREPVYGDHEYPIDGDAIPSLRAKANKFLGHHGIPWRVSVRTRPEPKVFLKNITTGPQ